MSKHFGWVLTLILCALPVFALTSAEEPLLKDSDHKKLGEKILDWIEAKSAKEGSAEALEKFRDELEKWGKKKQVGDRDPLSLVSDLGQALWYSFDFDSQKGTVKGKVKDIEVKDSNPELNYTVHAPSRYSAKNAYPLLLLIPEAGKRPFDYITEDWILDELRENAILVAVHMPEDKSAWSVIKTESGELGGIATILRTFGEVRSRYAIDFDKVFLVGRMEGLQTAMVAANQFPDRFAGVIGRTGDFKDVSPDNFQNTPTFFAGGGAGATAFKEGVEAAKYSNCTVAPDANEEDIWRWVQETRRASNPAEVTLKPGIPFPNRSYWLGIPPWDGEGTARIHGKVNREENTITIEGTGVVSVVISFNDELVDLSKPVKVICNGVESVDLIRRSSETLLNYTYVARNEPGKLYTASKEYGLAPRAETGGGSGENGK